jgi:prevent-host-death family protein
MKYSTQIRPISYLKSHAAEIVHELTSQRTHMIITQNGEATFVIQDVKSFEEGRETLALLRILALGNRQIEAGKVQSFSSVAKKLRQKTA